MGHVSRLLLQAVGEARGAGHRRRWHGAVTARDLPSAECLLQRLPGLCAHKHPNMSCELWILLGPMLLRKILQAPNFKTTLVSQQAGREERKEGEEKGGKKG